jgi:DNA-binding ferritin-like protein
MADDARPHDPIATLNQVLSEVIDVVQDVKQAHRKVPETHALHVVLDQLFADLGRWARLLMDRDEALGVSALESMPSVAGREPPNLWPGGATDEEVRLLLGEHLDRLAQHVAAALAEQDDDGSRAALATLERELLVRRRALSEL